MKKKILVIFISFIFLFTYTIKCFAVTEFLKIENVNEEIENITIDKETNDCIIENFEEDINSNKDSKDKKEDSDKQIVDIDNNMFINKEKIVTDENIINKEEFEQKIDEDLTENNIGAIKDSGMLHIDSPVMGQLFNTRIDGNIISISGWAVSNDSNAKLQCLLDEDIVNVNFERVTRNDVDDIISPRFGGTIATPKAGFNCLMDIGIVRTGMHLLKIKELSEDNQLICETQIPLNIENQSYIGNMYIDVPVLNQTYIKPDNTKITISGWAVSDDSKAILQVFVDGKNISTTIQRTIREDIDKLISPSFGGITVNPKAGFQMEIDISNYSAGKHDLRIKQLSRNNDLLCEAETSFVVENKKYIGRVFVDNPKINTTYTRPDDKRVLLQGWAVANDINAKFQIFVDGNIINTNIERFSREDVDKLISNQYGGTKETPKAGFQVGINISNYSTGKHSIKIKELSRNNDLLGEAETTFFITNKKYNGNMYIDSPSDNKVYIRPDNKNITLNGWAVSDDDNSTLQVLIDGNNVNSTIKKFQREDVDKLISPKYGGKTLTPQAGFQAIVDISYLDKGSHTIKIQNLSRYGELICEVSKTIKIENKKYSR